jgi:four helix bundle protein
MPEPNGRIRSHRDLKIWQRAMDLVDVVYDLTEHFPKREEYGLSAQIRSAAVSVPGNIAEGQGRNTTREFLRFLSIARGSLRELDTYIEISARRDYAAGPELLAVQRMLEEIGRMNTALCAALRKRLGPTNH